VDLLKTVATIVVVTIAFPFVLSLTASIWSYGSMKGRDLYRQNKDRQSQKDS
jgi:hypothetical protein